MKKNRELYQALELAGLIPLLAWWGIERVWPERMLLQAVVLLPGTVLWVQHQSSTGASHRPGKSV